MKPVPSAGSPRRRSIVNRASLVDKRNEEINDDEAERAALLAEDRTKASSQFSTPQSSASRPSISSTNSINSPQKEHFQGCLKLYAENKINKDNAWNLQLIDFMSSMLRRHDSRMENLQMASTTLDASTRIYSFRVDAIHHDVLKMAGGLSKATQGRRGKKPDGEDDDENTQGDQDGEGGAGGKKEKKKKASKGSLSTNVEHQLNGEVEINECIDPFFAQLAATTGDMTSSNRAFNATLPIDDKTLGLVLRSDVPFLDITNLSTNKELDYKNLECYEMKKSSFPVIKDTDQICAPFHGFSLTNWDPDDEEAKMNTNTNKWVENNLNLSQQAMAFDLNADVEPLPSDMTNNFNYDDNDGPVESDEEEMGVMKHAIKRDKARVVAHLVDMRPSSHADAFLEYSYSSAVIGSWAGPSHWKLKNNVNRFSRMAEKSQTITNVMVKKAPSRKKKQLDFLGTGMSFNRKCTECPEYSAIVAAKIMIGRKTLSQGNAWSEKNFKTPIDRGFNLTHFRKFYLKQSVVLKTVNEETNKNQNDISHRLSDMNDYDYNNDNDTSYCPNSQPNDEGEGWLGEEGHEDHLAGDVHNQNKLPDINGDMVEPPAKVAKIFIPYAMRAKKVDMKQLKQVSWKMLTEGGANKENDPSGGEADHVRETNFSNFYKKLPLKLSTNMKESLSVSLSLLAVLHLANEKGLQLKNNDDFTDFTISGQENE